MVLISTHMSEVGEEQFSAQFHKGGITDVAYSPELRQAAAAGSTTIKVGTQKVTQRFIRCLEMPRVALDNRVENRPV